MLFQAMLPQSWHFRCHDSPLINEGAKVRYCTSNNNLPFSLPEQEKLGFTFLGESCIVFTNRVGDLALSATGTGSCPEDEGFFHDEVTAPAVAYRKSSFM